MRIIIWWATIPTPGEIRHYRVDKMLHIRMSDEPREGERTFPKLDMADYSKKSFGMFGGKEQRVKLLVDNSLAGVIIDRFGKEVMMIPADPEHFTVNVTVNGQQRIPRVDLFPGERVKILGPEEVVEKMREEGERLVRQYCGE